MGFGTGIPAKGSSKAGRGHMIPTNSRRKQVREWRFMKHAYMCLLQSLVIDIDKRGKRTSIPLAAPNARDGKTFVQSLAVFDFLNLCVV